ncbi:porimin [Falco peregrinus]|uniref:porimin n=1 Tax=Falco peregrinus TaxID=8954 RepID=UPI00247B17B1|nr:porimin [Falco peregrinus]
MRLLAGASCALRAAALLLLLTPGSQMNISSSTAPFSTVPDPKLQGNNSSFNLTVISFTQSTTTSAVGVSTNTTHLTSQPTNTTMPVTLTTQTTKTSQTTRSTTASSVTSSQLNTTVAVTTSKISLTSVTATSKSEAVVPKTSRFDVGSFVGGIVLTLGVLVILYIGCKTYHSRRGIQYRTIDEHDAII